MTPFRAIRRLWDRVIDVPRDRYDDELPYWRARSLRTLMAITMLGIGLWMPLCVALVGPGGLGSDARFQSSVFYLLLASLLYFLAGRGSRVLLVTCWAFLPLQFAGMLWNALRGNGIFDASITADLSAVMLAALLVGRRAVLVAAAGGIVVVLLIYGASLRGLVAHPVPVAVADLTTTTVTHVLTLVFVAALLLLWERQHRRLFDKALRTSTQRRVAELQQEYVRLTIHELRTPLQALSNTAQVALRQARGDSNPLGALELMEGPLRRLKRLVEDMVDATRLEVGTINIRLGPCDLRAVCTEAVDAIELIHGRAVRLEKPPGPVRVQADRERMAQVLENLLGNALDYTPAGGEVSLSLAVDGGEAVLAVRDQGPGIAPEHLPYVFERFYRVPGPKVQGSAGAKAGAGLGLGLYLCRGFVERHHGRIWVESPPGRGCTFYAALPLDPGP